MLKYNTLRDAPTEPLRTVFSGNTSKMTASSSKVSTASVTIHAVSLPPQTTIPVLDAAEVKGYGFRQYPTVESLLDATAPSSVGCVLICATNDLARNLAIVSRIKTHFHSIPLIVLQNADSTENTVEFMQQGVYSVISQPFEHQKLLNTITEAVELSIGQQSTVDTCRESLLRMNEATEKELEVLRLIMQGKKNKEISAALGITVRAVEDRRFRLMKKVGVDSVAELVALAVTAEYYQQGFKVPGTSLQANVVNSRQCIRGIEIWTPNHDETFLKLQQYCYRDAATLQEARQTMTFCRGEGLPGTVWKQRAPAFLDELITSDFGRSRDAGAAGMTTAIGFPIFCEGQVQAVVLILVDGRHQLKAVFESWRLDPLTSHLRLANGSYINCEKLRRLSEFVHLPVGDGLAGISAEQGRPYIGARFSEDGNAVRGLAISAENLLSGVALPLTDSGTAVSDVLLMFNSETSAMFSLLQIWKPSPDGLSVSLTTEYANGVPSLASQMSSLNQPTTGSIAYDCWQQKTPIVADNEMANERIARGAFSVSPTFGLAIPTFVNGRVVAVTVLAN